MKNLQVKILAGAMLVGFGLAGSNAYAAADDTTQVIPGFSCKAYADGETGYFTTDWDRLKNTSANSTWVQCGIDSTDGAVVGAHVGEATSKVNINLDHGTAFAAYNCYIARTNAANGKREVLNEQSATLVSGVQSAPVLKAGEFLASSAAGAVAINNTYVAGCLMSPGQSLISVNVLTDSTK